MISPHRAATASVRLVASNFSRMLLTWVLTVPSLIFNSRAMSRIYSVSGGEDVALDIFKMKPKSLCLVVR